MLQSYENYHLCKKSALPYQPPGLDTPDKNSKIAKFYCFSFLLTYLSNNNFMKILKFHEFVI